MSDSKVDFDEITSHTSGDDCPVCRAQEMAYVALLPAAAAWEANSELPRFSLSLHGAASLLGTMLQEGVAREDIDSALSELLDEIEAQIAEHDMLGGPTQGNA